METSIIFLKWVSLKPKDDTTSGVVNVFPAGTTFVYIVARVVDSHLGCIRLSWL